MSYGKSTKNTLSPYYFQTLFVELAYICPTNFTISDFLCRWIGNFFPIPWSVSDWVRFGSPKTLRKWSNPTVAYLTSNGLVKNHQLAPNIPFFLIDSYRDPYNGPLSTLIKKELESKIPLQQITRVNSIGTAHNWGTAIFAAGYWACCFERITTDQPTPRKKNVPPALENKVFYIRPY